MQTDPGITDAQIRQYTKPLVGENLPAETLDAVLDAYPIAIVYFLRHFGCVHCRFIVQELKKLKESNPRFPTVIFVHQEGLAEARTFFGERYPGAVHISDPKRELYNLFGIRRATTAGLLDPRMLVKSALRVLGGISQALKPTSDPRTLSGVFLFFNGKLKWAHRATYAGDDEQAVKMLTLLGKKPDTLAAIA
jgi:hypothetical protein